MSKTQLCGNCKHLICENNEWRCRMFPLKGKGAFKMLAWSEVRGKGFMPTRHWKCKAANMFEEAAE